MQTVCMEKKLLLGLVAFTVIVTAGCDLSEPVSSQEAGAEAANEELAREYVQAYNERDVAQLEKILADRILIDGEEIQQSVFLEGVEGYWEAFPDFRFDEPFIVGAEKYVTVHVQFEATGTGEFEGHDVGGKKTRASEMILFGVNDGRFDEYRYEWDELGFWQHLGVVDNPYATEHGNNQK